MFSHENIAFNTITVEILDEEKSKSFMGSAGVGLAGAVVFGPLGLIAGALAGGNKTTGVFGLTFKLNDQEVKLVVKTSNKDEIRCFKEKSFTSLAS